MGLPTKTNLQTLDYSRQGAPWVRVASKSGIDLDGLDYTYQGQPFWGVEEAAGGTNGTVSAVAGTASAAGLAPTLSADISISGVLATATAVMLVPAISTGADVSVTGVVATADAAALVPAVSSSVEVTAVAATSNAAGQAPSLSGDASIIAALATAPAAGLAPALSAGVNVTGAAATAAAAGIVPSLSSGVSITAVTATAPAAGVAPRPDVSTDIALATATAAALVPSLSSGVDVGAVVGTASAAGLAPAVSGSGASEVLAVTATATAAGLSPTVTGERWTLVYPASDTYVGNWTGEGGETINLYSHIDEASYSDTDYIRSENSPTNSPCVVKLGALTDPGTASGHVLRYRYAKGAGGGTTNLTVQLRQGYVNESSTGALIAEWTHSDISEVVGGTAQTLTDVQADSITDYASLFIRMVAA